MNNPQIDAHGHKFWYNEENQLHRLEWANGTKEWYQNGELHRLYANGNQEWYQNGELTSIFLQNGLRHREDGPAANGTKFWFQNGEYHRIFKCTVLFGIEYKKKHKDCHCDCHKDEDKNEH